MDAATILIVDDNRPLARALAELLARRSFRTLVADSAAAALRLACRLRPDLVIADLDLPDFSGAELAERLAAAVPRTAVILVTASAGERVIPRLAASVLATVGKPFDPLRLVALVREALGRPRPRHGGLPSVSVRFPLVQARRLLPMVRASRAAEGTGSEPRRGARAPSPPRSNRFRVC